MSSDCTTCEFCNREFKRQADLIRHQETTKYCLKIQGKINKETVEEYVCKGCKRVLSSKYSLKRHEISCVHIIEDKKYETLKKEIVSMIKGNNQNVVVNNLQPLTDEHIKEHLAHLSLSFIEGGAKGFASFANEYPFKNSIICTDRSRKKFQYKLESGIVISDYGTKLAQQFFQSIATKNKEIINEEYRNIQDELQNLIDNGCRDQIKLTELLSKASQLQETLFLCEQAAMGTENKLTQGFLKHLVKIV